MHQFSLSMLEFLSLGLLLVDRRLKCVFALSDDVVLC